MRGLRQLAAAVGTLTTALALLLLGAPPSAAGGPTSVLLVSPTSQRTASLYGTEKQYDLLVRLLAPTGSALDANGEEAPEWARGDTAGEQISEMVTVTWMIHDVTPWRVDQLYTASPDTKDVWIHTDLDIAKDTGASDDGVWNKAKQSEELRALLQGLGVLGEASGSPEQGEASSPDALSGARVDAVETAVDAPAGADAPDLTDRARWAIPALALGLLLGSGGAMLLLRRAAARHESGPPREPRQELLDA
ncbi:hypothetical protein [Streptomyces europaeiscabiei]|uniref:hypothetical protein n=1 Tax=Streptomyces europaeiscabiei TaxID=146819 RepID=UPI0029B7A9B8|nr:hypothetical protein [Streptomyces europaeiscabiei]MDX2773165.1 hypothetical protein [Streptomyces europaeiscabiei]